MSDMATVRQAVLEEWKLPDQTTPDVVTHEVNRCICAALADLRPYSFWFNTARFTLETVASQQSYGRNDYGGSVATKLPWGFWAVAQTPLYLDHEKAGGTTQYYTHIDVVDLGIFDELDSRTTQSGRPEWAAVRQRQLDLIPIPDSADYVRGVAVLDLGTPVPRYDTGAWEYHLHQPSGAEVAAAGINTSTFATAWMTEAAAFDVLVARTAMVYLRRFARDQDLGAVAEQQYLLALAALKRNDAAQIRLGELEPWMGD